jgi:hypothetical protein
MPRGDTCLQDHRPFGPSCMGKRGALQQFFAMSAVMIDLMRRQAVLSSAGCPKTEQKLNHIASLGSFGMPERRILESLRGTPYPM